MGLTSSLLSTDSNNTSITSSDTPTINSDYVSSVSSALATPPPPVLKVPATSSAPTNPRMVPRIDPNGFKALGLSPFMISRCKDLGRWQVLHTEDCFV